MVNYINIENIRVVSLMASLKIRVTSQMVNYKYINGLESEGSLYVVLKVDISMKSKSSGSRFKVATFSRAW